MESHQTASAIMAWQPLILIKARDAEVALPLSAVNRVIEIRSDELNFIPRAPQAILGVTNYWGRIVTVIDLAPLLDGQPNPIDHNGLLPVLILEYGQRQVGLMINSITEILISRDQNRLESRGEGLITHMIEMQDRAVGVVSVERLICSLRQRFADAAKA